MQMNWALDNPFSENGIPRLSAEMCSTAKPAAALLREHFERDRKSTQVASTAYYNKHNDQLIPGPLYYDLDFL